MNDIETTSREARFLQGTNFRLGFTLIELLGVLAIIGLLAGIVLGTAGYVQRKAGSFRARAEISAMETALDAYKNDNGFYPTSSVVRVSCSGLAAVTNSWYLYKALVGGSKKYLHPTRSQWVINNTLTNLVDPFGKPYNYYCTRPPINVLTVDNSTYASGFAIGGQVNLVTFDLWSFGPDGSTFVPGATAAAWVVVNGALSFITSNSSLDDITNWQ